MIESARRIEYTSLPERATRNTFALVDCNNFYVSCERVFNPQLRGVPVIVLSNNDGCIVARSNEAKRLGIGMADPFFRYKDVVLKNHVRVFSSNYHLYGDMSRRVMSILSHYSPEMEVYSIDEAFLDFSGCGRIGEQGKLTEYGRKIRANVMRWTGIPVSIGIASTKTLAKVAGHVAKKSGDGDGVFNLIEEDSADSVLERVDVADIWGVGPKSAEKLRTYGIRNAKQLRDIDDRLVRSKLGVVGSRVVSELRGIACYSLHSDDEPRKGILCSRSFGEPVSSVNDLKEAIASYVHTAAGRLREQGSAANLLTVFMLTSQFIRESDRYKNSLSIRLPAPTNNTSELLHRAVTAAEKIYRAGFKYKKAGVRLDDLVPADQLQTDLFESPGGTKRARLMDTVDQLNRQMGKGTLTYASQGNRQPWKMKCELRSPRYTTSWDELAIAKGN